ncbi:hypothetical protein [Pseudomonas sp. 1152_12]|uniref:hypothetical protein n=1 Tax=Pseudomonas sp. 1152_12 TaxID=2604455 RepID=UPI00406473D8
MFSLLGFVIDASVCQGIDKGLGSGGVHQQLSFDWASGVLGVALKQSSDLESE